MGEIISSLEKSIGNFIDEISHIVWESTKKYIIPPIAVGGILFGGFYYIFCPSVNYILPEVKNLFDYDNNSLALKYKKDSLIEKKPEESKKEEKELIQKEIERINSISDLRLRIDETEKLMEKLDILRN